MPAILIRELTKYYNSFLALDNLSLEIEQGESVALLGPNGAGKTTTLKIICGVLRPTRGTVYLNEISVLSEREKALTQIGAILETPEFYPFLTASETLSYLGSLRGMNSTELDEKISEVLSLVELKEWANVKVGKFSRGMKQRLALAQAILHDPPILILDEPSLDLDPRGMFEMREMIKGMKGRKTILLATHLLHEAGQVCDKIAILEGGKLRAYCEVKKLEEEYGSLEKGYIALTGGT